MKVAYVVDRFPVLSQTFVVNEIADHLRNGLDVEILSMGAAEMPTSRPTTFLRSLPAVSVISTSASPEIATPR